MAETIDELINHVVTEAIKLANVFYARHGLAAKDEPIISAKDALRAHVAALEAKLAETEAANRWIPVGERLPEKDTFVWVYAIENRDRFFCMGRMESDDEYAGQWRDNEHWPISVTHWRPLPPPPEEKREDK